MIDFKDSTLFISARSPFARRVRLALAEHEQVFEERLLDVFKPNPELIALNPLARVPTLQCKSGEVVIDSEKILDLFYRSHPQSPLLPSTEEDRLVCMHWSAIALGLCDKTVEYYLETLRPEGARDGELLVEVRDIAQRILVRFDAFIGTRATVIEGRLTQADLDLGAALSYFTLRYSKQWKSRYSNAAAYLAKLEERPSFHATRPPA